MHHIVINTLLEAIQPKTDFQRESIVQTSREDHPNLSEFLRAIAKLKTMTEVLLKVEMTCSGCSGAVERILTRSKDKGEGIESFNVDLETQKVTIVLAEGSELTEETLIEKVTQI